MKVKVNAFMQHNEMKYPTSNSLSADTETRPRRRYATAGNRCQYSAPHAAYAETSAIVLPHAFTLGIFNSGHPLSTSRNQLTDPEGTESLVGCICIRELNPDPPHTRVQRSETASDLNHSATQTDTLEICDSFHS
jgi:hypothetical protein